MREREKERERERLQKQIKQFRNKYKREINVFN